MPNTVTTKNPHAASKEAGGEANDRRMSAGARKRPVLVEGTVVRVIEGAYTMVCQFPGVGEVPTIYCPAMVSGYIGASSYEMPTEGTQVLAYHTTESPYHYVIAVLPAIEAGIDPDFLDELEPEWRRENPQELEQEPGSDYESVQSHVEPNVDDTTDDHVQTNSGRPWNVLAGEWARGNKMGVAVAIMHFHALLQANDKAKLEMSVFDDLVRLTSGTYEHNSSIGRTRIFDDEGELSMESSGSVRSWERLGEDEPKEVITDLGEATENSVPYSRPEIEPKDRFRMFYGALADLFQFYARNPYQSETDDRSGTARVSVDYDGHVGVHSRAGISIGLKERIPVPKRVKEPWDLEGDTEVTRVPKMPFEFDPAYPYGRNLQMAEYRAWRDKLIYQRFDEMENEFVVPEHSEVQQPPEGTDSEGSTSAVPASPDCGVDFLDDGSIRFYESGGAELYMRGGKVIVSAPNGMEQHIGGSLVSLVTQDIIMKAHQSIDVHATEKDVRVTSGGLTHLHSIGKGTLITTDSEGLSVDGGEGEEYNARGIVIGKPGSDVALVGNDLTMVAEGGVKVKAENVIVSAAKRLTQVAENVFISGGGGSALKLGAAACTVIGRAMSLVAGAAFNFFKGDQILQAQWVDLDSPAPYDAQSAKVESGYATYAEGEDWLSGMKESDRKNVRFTYRTPEQYGTDSGGAEQFMVYMPLWQLLEEPSETWTEEEIEGTFPWPGQGVRETSFLIYERGENVDDDGDPKTRSEMQSTGGSFSQASFDDYGIK